MCQSLTQTETDSELTHNANRERNGANGYTAVSNRSSIGLKRWSAVSRECRNGRAATLANCPSALRLLR